MIENVLVARAPGIGGVRAIAAYRGSIGDAKYLVNIASLEQFYMYACIYAQSSRFESSIPGSKIEQLLHIAIPLYLQDRGEPLPSRHNLTSSRD